MDPEIPFIGSPERYMPLRMEPLIPVAGTKIWGNELKYLQDCVETGWFSSLGKYVNQFETLFAKKIGTEHGIACTSGTTGLFCVLHAMEITEGDEVIVPNFSIIVTANVVMMTGARPVLVDVEPDTGCIDPEKIEAAITPKTKAIMVVHMYGHPANMTRINEIAEKYKLYVVEDCCQSHGAEWKSIKTGNLSHASVFSFYANKILTTGEGGLILTNNHELAKKLRTYIDNGFQIPRFIHKVMGFNLRLSNLQAAVGLAQTEKLEEAVERKREIAFRYMRNFKDFEHLQMPVEKQFAKNVYWMFSILVKDSFGLTKDQLMNALMEDRIQTRSFFYGMHQQPVFQNTSHPSAPNIKGSWPVSEDLARRGMYLPTGLDLTDAQIDWVSEKVRSKAKSNL